LEPPLRLALVRLLLSRLGRVGLLVPRLRLLGGRPLARGTDVRTLVRGQVARPLLAGGLEPQGLGAVGELDVTERQPVRLELGVRRPGEGRGQLGVVERRLALAGLGIDQDELLGPALQVVAVPELGVVGEPVRGELAFGDVGAGAELPFTLWGVLSGGETDESEGQDRDGESGARHGWIPRMRRCGVCVRLSRPVWCRQ